MLKKVSRCYMTDARKKPVVLRLAPILKSETALGEEAARGDLLRC
jgi:hypothetical protein